MIRAALILALLAGPAHAKWDYCYSQEGVGQAYPELPPRTFGFELAILPYAFKRLCALDADSEGGAVWQLVIDDLECTPASDYAQRVEHVLDADLAQLGQIYLGTPTLPDGPAWTRVCLAAQEASVVSLSFADTWYFDSPTADAENARLSALLEALNALTTALQNADGGDQ